MKSLQRLRLINWHYFSNTTTEIKNISFLTGPNGTGKSTIIDALQVIILGTTRPENFNKAANEKGRTGRNLLSYLRGQTGIGPDGKALVLRNGTFTSYVAIELFDDVSSSTITLGAVFDVDDADKIDKHYFYLDSPFPENGFTDSDTQKAKSKVLPMRYRDLSAWARSTYGSSRYRFFDTDTDYQSFIKEVYGNLPDKYFSLFKKAVSFSPISNISSFITEYICDADLNVDITPMQKNIEQYKILETEAKNLRNKVEALTAIHSAYEEMSGFDRQINMLNYVNARVSYEEAKKKLDVFQERLAKDNERLAYIGDSIAKADSQLEDLRSDYNSYNAKRLQSDKYSLTEKLSMKKDDVTRQISSIQMQVSNVITSLNGYADSYLRVTNSFYNYYKDFDANKLGEDVKDDFDHLLELVSDVGREAKAILDSIDQNNIDLSEVHAFRNDMETLRNDALSLKTLLNNGFYRVSEQLQSLQNDLMNVSNGKKPFDKLGPVYLTIKRDLETALQARHSDAYVHIFCDLVDVNDPEWQMALEAVIFSQKFNFFVNPRYYIEANRILKELTDSYHYYRVSIVDSEKLLNSDIRSDEGSLADLIDTKDEGARAYSDYLLGRIRKCRTFEEARDSGSGLLSDCTGYRGFATWYLNKANARTFYLGTSVSNSTKATSSADYQEMNKRYSLYSEAINKISDLLTLPVMSDNELGTYQSDIDRTNAIPDLQKQISDLDSQMKAVATGDMTAIDQKIAEINASIKTISEDRNNLLTERGQLLADTQRLNGEDIPTATKTAEDLRRQLVSYDETLVNEQYEPFFEKLLDEQHLTLAQIRNEGYREFIQAQAKQSKAKNMLLKLRGDYCAQNSVSYDAQNLQSNAEFDQELDKISKVMLPDYEQKISKAHEDSIREFKDDFIYKLRTAIETVQAQIVDLNHALEDSHFGRDSYQFKVAPNKDYLEYYNMIMDPFLLRSGDAESLFMEKYRTTMDDLFNLISSSTSASGEQKEQILRNVALFTTYTTYIVFDLLVTRGEGENKNTISLGRSFTSQSGGETQTPFYIAILASFAQLCRVNNAKDNNTLRLVIFDEAFSKMDSARIMKATDLLRNFGLQAILSTPSEKLRDLVSYVDLILVTMHDDKRKRSYLDVYLDKNKDRQRTPSEPSVEPEEEAEAPEIASPEREA